MGFIWFPPFMMQVFWGTALGPLAGRTNQEVVDFIVRGGQMDPPKGCAGPVWE